MTPDTTRIWPDSTALLERSRGVFFAHWEEMLRLKQRVIETSDIDDIHDLRVASRRFRAVLELFYPFAPKKLRTELKKNVRSLTRLLGGLRNIDEAQLFFSSHLQTNNPPDGKLFRSLAALRVREMKRIRKALNSFDQRALDRIARKVIRQLNSDAIKGRKSASLPAYFSEVSIRQYKPIRRLLAASTAPGQRLSRHALRIAIKKWRYFFEIIAQILDRDYTPFLEKLKEYQSILGRMNDIVEFEVLLDQLKLPADQREQAKAALLTEDALLLKNFTALVERKPLTYTFLIQEAT